MSAFYRATVADFLTTQPATLMLELTSGVAGMGFDLRADQHSAWIEQAQVLHDSLSRLRSNAAEIATWGLLLEYQIPGRPKRLDAVLLDGAGIIAIEFKVGSTELRAADKWQLREYCWNLRDFHRESEGIPIAPVLVATGAPEPEGTPAGGYEDRQKMVQRMLVANAQTLAAALATAHKRLVSSGIRSLDLGRWDASQAQPTRTVIEEAQKLFSAHDVREITHAHADNTADAIDSILRIVRASRESGLRSICLVTGVPGAGKTLVGLHAAYSPAMLDAAGGNASFASGNQPLLDVLNAALALNRTRERRERREIGHSLSAPVENVHRFALSHLLDPENRPPPQQVVIFDEAQRVWTAKKVASGLDKRVQRSQLTGEQRDAILALPHSEPDFLLRVMERCLEWCVVIALVGGGQEIHDGEAGLGAWGRALASTAERWSVWVSPEAIQGGASVAGQTLFVHGCPPGIDVRAEPALHLNVAKRCIRAERYAEWVNYVLDWQPEAAARLMPELVEFPILLTRDISEARRLLRDFAGDETRFGLFASSGAIRLRADGIELKREFRDSLKFPDWFLRPIGDIRSSNQLEIAATEFECQGLELDWSCVCWGGDLLPDADSLGWRYWKSHGASRREEADLMKCEFIRNKYRVLMTRARFGTVVSFHAATAPTGRENRRDLIRWQITYAAVACSSTFRIHATHPRAETGCDCTPSGLFQNSEEVQ